MTIRNWFTMFSAFARREEGQTMAEYAVILTVIAAVAITALGALTMSMYTPSMPAIAQALAATPGMVQVTLTIYLVGFAVGQLIYGPLSDRFGRRSILLAGVVAYILTSVLCAISPTVGLLSHGTGPAAVGNSSSPTLLLLP